MPWRVVSCRLRFRRGSGGPAGLRRGARDPAGHHHLGPVQGVLMPRSARSSRLRDDRGSATAETAIVLPVVVVMVVVVLLTGAGLGAQLRLEGAARGAARELARGEDPAAAVAVAERIGGGGPQGAGRAAGAR